MKRMLTLLAALLLGWSAPAQEAPARAEGYHYVNATELPLGGKVLPETSARYERLPASLEGVARKPVWRLGRNSAGLYVRFRSDATAVRLRWTSLGKHYMNHMSPTGDRGVDLYILNDKGQWQFARSGRPGKEATTDALVIEHMAPKMREFMVYLSLYDGVTDLEIGVPEGAVVEQPALESPKRSRPVIMYGTSILQGGCACRPGMAYTNILSRRLDREVINLGFSGNALLDPEIARWMASAPDPGVFVLDESPNCSAKLIEEKGEAFFRILRDAHPDVPVVFVDMTPFPYRAFDQECDKNVARISAAQRALYERLKKAGEKRIYFVPGDRMLSPDGEGSVDGRHLTDLDMVHYADLLEPVLRKALKKSR